MSFSSSSSGGTCCEKTSCRTRITVDAEFSSSNYAEYQYRVGEPRDTQLIQGLDRQALRTATLVLASYFVLLIMLLLPPPRLLLLLLQLYADDIVFFQNERTKTASIRRGVPSCWFNTTFSIRPA